MRIVQRTRNYPDLRELAIVASLACLTVLIAFAAQGYGWLWATVAFVLVPSLLVIFPAVITQIGRLLAAARDQVSWWHVLWVLLFLSDLTFRIRTAGDIERDAVDSWAAYRISLVSIAGAILLFRLGLRGAGWIGSLFRGLVGALALYALICAISTVWSVYPAWTFYKSFEYMVDVAFLAAILVSAKSEREWRALFNWNYALQVILVGSAWLGALIWPQEAFTHSRGIFTAQLTGVLPMVPSNGLGEMGAILAVVSLGRLAGRTEKTASARVMLVLLFVTGLATTILSQTRSAALGLFVGSVLVLFFARRKKLLLALVLTGLFLFALTSVGSLGEEFLRRGQTDEQVQGLSGRVGYWTFGWQQYLKHPFTGLGAYTARFTVLDKLGEGETSSIHNSYMEVLIGVGPIGLVPLLVALFGTWRIAIRFLRSMASVAIDHPLAVDCIGLLAVITVRSFFTIEMIWHPPLLFMVVLGYAEFLRRQDLQPRTLRYRQAVDGNV